MLVLIWFLCLFGVAIIQALIRIQDYIEESASKEEKV